MQFGLEVGCTRKNRSTKLPFKTQSRNKRSFKSRGINQSFIFRTDAWGDHQLCLKQWDAVTRNYFSRFAFAKSGHTAYFWVDFLWETHLNPFIAKDSEISVDKCIFFLFGENKHVTRTRNLKENSRCNVKMEIMAGIPCKYFWINLLVIPIALLRNLFSVHSSVVNHNGTAVISGKRQPHGDEIPQIHTHA